MHVKLHKQVHENLYLNIYVNLGLSLTTGFLNNRTLMIKTIQKDNGKEKKI